VLVDVLLALLARPAAPLPAAPLREAVEALFRATCTELTPAGLQDLVRVVGRAAEQGNGAGEGLLGLLGLLGLGLLLWCWG
jgi:DNA polymerase phi